MPELHSWARERESQQRREPAAGASGRARAALWGIIAEEARRRGRRSRWLPRSSASIVAAKLARKRIPRWSLGKLSSLFSSLCFPPRRPMCSFFFFDTHQRARVACVHVCVCVLLCADAVAGGFFFGASWGPAFCVTRRCTMREW